jgi:hypothetical protein
MFRRYLLGVVANGEISCVFLELFYFQREVAFEYIFSLSFREKNGGKDVVR